MAEPIVVEDIGSSKITSINPLAIDETVADAKEPKSIRAPGDNPLSRDLVQVSDEPTALEPASLDAHTTRPIVRNSNNSPASTEGVVRQSSYLVRQPSGETGGLSAVDPLEVSRTLAAPPTSAGVFRALPPVGGPGVSASRAIVPNGPAQPIFRGSPNRPANYAVAAVPTTIQPSFVAPAPPAFRPAPSLAGSAGNPLRAMPSGNEQGVSTLVTNGVELPASVDSQRNPLR
jgi:hypothetical protein